MGNADESRPRRFLDARSLAGSALIAAVAGTGARGQEPGPGLLASAPPTGPAAERPEGNLTFLEPSRAEWLPFASPFGDPTQAGGTGRAPVDGGWRFELTPYFWASGFSGRVGVGSATATVHAAFGDVLDVLNLAGAVHFEAARGPWSIFADGSYGSFEAESGLGPGGEVEGEVTMTMAELGGGYRLESAPWLQVIAGGRYTGIEAEVEATGVVLAFDEQGSEWWIDPFVGARIHSDLDPNWFVELRGDVGGFGAASDLAVNFIGEVGWRLSDTVNLRLGYQVLDVDFETGAGENRFKYEIVSTGVRGGIGFRF